jgi:hypothetical protein
MNSAQFTESLADEAPKSGLSVPLVALWWDAKGNWAQAQPQKRSVTTPVMSQRWWSGRTPARFLRRHGAKTAGRTQHGVERSSGGLKPREKSHRCVAKWSFFRGHGIRTGRRFEEYPAAARRSVTGWVDHYRISRASEQYERVHFPVAIPQILCHIDVA